MESNKEQVEKQEYVRNMKKFWKVSEYIQPKNPINRYNQAMFYNNGLIPVFTFDWESYENTLKYSGKKLRELRAKNGCSKIKTKA